MPTPEPKKKLYERYPVCTHLGVLNLTCRLCDGVGFVQTGLTLDQVDRALAIAAEAIRLRALLVEAREYVRTVNLLPRHPDIPDDALLARIDAELVGTPLPTHKADG